MSDEETADGVGEYEEEEEYNEDQGEEEYNEDEDYEEEGGEEEHEEEIPSITGMFYGPDLVGNLRGELNTLHNNITAQSWYTVSVGYWPFHLFRKMKKASPRESFMQIAARQENSEVMDAYLLLWENSCGPVGNPTHVIPLIVDQEKRWAMGRASRSTSKDQVRLVVRVDTKRKAEKICFAVGKDNINKFARLLAPYVSIVPRDKKKKFGAEMKTFKVEDLA